MHRPCLVAALLVLRVTKSLVKYRATAFQYQFCDGNLRLNEEEVYRVAATRCMPNLNDNDGAAVKRRIRIVLGLVIVVGTLLAAPTFAGASTSVSGVGSPLSPLVIDPGSTSGALATDDLMLTTGTVVAHIANMPDTRDVGTVTLGAFKRGPGCSTSVPVTLQVWEDPGTTWLNGDTISVSREPVDFTSTAANVEFDMRPFTMRAGHSYAFFIYHGSDTCIWGTRYTWPHNESTVTGGSASVCHQFPMPSWTTKWRIWHENPYSDDPGCYLQNNGVDSSMPTGWLQAAGYGGVAVETYLVDPLTGPPYYPCVPGTQGVYWRQYPPAPQWEEWVCAYDGFSDPTTTMTDGWYYAGSWDEDTGGDPRDAYLKLEPPDYQTLLEQHAPILAFDSGEDFFPQEASAFTNNGTTPGTYSLTYANQLYSGSAVLAAGGSPGTGSLPPELTLDTLGPTYNFGTSSHPIANGSDFIDARGSTKLAAFSDSVVMRTLGHGSVVYGRFVQDPSDHRLWLQYWIFYYYNSFDVLGFGLHEGDWEMVQVGLESSTLTPVEATYSIHETTGQGCYWSQILVDEATGQRPFVFVGAGSHASYPFVGSSGINISGVPTPVSDNHWGDGDVADDIPIEVANGQRWWEWPGRWGASAGGGTDAPSPQSPSQQGIKWTDPSQFADNSDHDHCPE